MTLNSIEQLLNPALQILQNMIALENLEEETIESLNQDFQVWHHRKLATENLENFSYAIERVFQEISELPYLLHLLPSFKEKIFSTHQMADRTIDMTIHAIAKICLIKKESSVDLSQKILLQKRLGEIAQSHLLKPKNQKTLSQTLVKMQNLALDEQLDWPLIDRLSWVFFTIQQTQKEHFYPESKKDR